MKYLMLLSFFLTVSCNTNPLGQSSSVGNNFHPGLNEVPEIKSISPTQGPLIGGTNITLSGKGFRPNSIIKLGGTICSSITFQSSQSILCLTPAHALGVVDVYIQNPDKQNHKLEDGFNFITNVPSLPGFGIVSGGNISTSASLSLESTIGDPYTGNVMMGTTTQLRVGTQGILFNP